MFAAESYDPGPNRAAAAAVSAAILDSPEKLHAPARTQAARPTCAPGGPHQEQKNQRQSESL